jgi:hypothetical protein
MSCAACDAASRRAQEEAKAKLTDNQALWEAIRDLQKRVEMLERGEVANP